tara:strand:- start:4725 stop:5225 length:501 start_codon:yes stop_codon:yes gene_type:complete
MGLFDRLKPKKESDESRKNRLMVILSDLGCNPHDFQHQNMSPYEISLREELDGVIKASDITFENEGAEFDYINLNDNRDGNKLLYMAINNREPRETKKLVDKYSSRLGEDIVMQNLFTSDDLYTLEHEPHGHLRTWYLTYFEIIIGFSNNEHGTATYVLVTEKNYK